MQGCYCLVAGKCEVAVQLNEHKVSVDPSLRNIQLSCLILLELLVHLVQYYLYWQVKIFESGTFCMPKHCAITELCSLWPSYPLSPPPPPSYQKLHLATFRHPSKLVKVLTGGLGFSFCVDDLVS